MITRRGGKTMKSMITGRPTLGKPSRRVDVTSNVKDIAGESIAMKLAMERYTSGCMAMPEASKSLSTLLNAFSNALPRGPKLA